jgi:hypothetical protein
MKVSNTFQYPITPIGETSNSKNKTQSTSRQNKKKIIENWIKETSSHGLPNVIKSKYWFIKIFWLFVYTLSFCYFSYTLTQSWLKYFSFGILTTLSNRNDEIVEFPAVDFCNLNPSPQDFNRSFFFNKLNYNDSISYYDDLSDGIKSLLYIKDMTTGQNPDITFKFNQMVISCYFNGIKCTQDDFYYYRDYNYGSCYKFNGGQIKSFKNYTTNGTMYTVNFLEKQVDLKTVTNSGPDNGLRLEVFVGDPTKVIYSNRNGIKLIVHNASIDTFPGDQGIEVSTGCQTNVAVSRTYTNKLGSPYSNCIRDLKESIDHYSNLDDTELTEILKKMQNVYKMKIYCQKTCLNMCKQNFIVKSCGCYDLKLPLPMEEISNFYKIHQNEYNDTIYFMYDTRITTPCLKFKINDMNCLLNARKSYTVKDGIQKCLKKCPLECETVKIEQEISSSDYPSLW